LAYTLQKAFATKRRTIMTKPSVAYTWELGIDLSAVLTAGGSYLRQGFVLQETQEMAPLLVNGTDTICFRIFDVTSSGTGVSKINSFSILTKAAVNLQGEGDPFDKLQLSLPDVGSNNNNSAVSIAFGGPHRFWDMGVVTVNNPTEPKRFLLSFLVQAAGSVSGSSRPFIVDPEMVVGPNM
jgi:hypothetical protein